MKEFDDLLSKATEQVMFILGNNDPIHYAEVFKVIEQTVIKCMLRDIQDRHD